MVEKLEVTPAVMCGLEEQKDGEQRSDGKIRKGREEDFKLKTKLKRKAEIIWRCAGWEKGNWMLLV